MGCCSGSPQRVFNDRYVHQGPLPPGGMSELYRCTDKLGEHGFVVVKTLQAKFQKNDSCVERFNMEIDIMQAMLEQNLCDFLPKYIDSFQEGDQEFYVQTWLNGENMAEYLQKHAAPLRAWQIKGFLDSILRILSVLHQPNVRIIHGDIKPSNIMLTSSGIYFLIDFGIANALNEDESHGSSRWWTDRYVAPEACLQEEARFENDIFSLGLCAIALANGNEECLGNGSLAERRKAIEDLHSKLDEPLLSVVLRMVEDDYRARGTADELLKALSLPLHPRLSLGAL